MNTSIDEALVMHEVLISIGFSVDDIYVGFADESIFVVLKTQDKTFTISCGPKPKINEDKLVRIWKESVQRWNGTHEKSLKTSEKNAIMDMSRFFKKGKAKALATLMLSMKNIGIEIPKKD